MTLVASSCRVRLPVRALRFERHHDVLDPLSATDLTRSGAALLATGEDLRASARRWRTGELD